jgi:hypothetical protein
MRKLFWVDLFVLLSFLLVSGLFGPPGACPAGSVVDDRKQRPSCERPLSAGLGSAGVAVCATAAVSVPKLVIAVRNSRLDRDRSSFPSLPPTSTYSNARKVNKSIDSKRTVCEAGGYST